MMMQMETEQAMIAAVLHDVVEDTPYSCDDLRRLGFAETVVETVDKLTRRNDESYEAFIERLQLDPVARAVKLADLSDNMDVRRLGTLTERDWQRLQRYKLAWNRLQELSTHDS
jgi:(p)ppGpp synthase/HD superfamily hydrolase